MTDESSDPESKKESSSEGGKEEESGEDEDGLAMDEPRRRKRRNSSGSEASMEEPNMVIKIKKSAGLLLLKGLDGSMIEDKYKNFHKYQRSVEMYHDWFKQFVCTASRVKMNDLTKHWESTVGAEENREALTNLTTTFIQNFVEENYGKKSLKKALKLVLRTMYLRNLPISEQSIQLISGLESESKGSTASRVVFGPNNDERYENEPVILSETREVIAKIIDWFATTTGDDIRFITRSEIPQHVWDQLPDLKRTVEQVKRKRNDWFEKMRFMVRAMISLMAATGFRHSQLWDLKIDSFIPEEMCGMEDATNPSLVKNARGGMVVSLPDRVALIVPFKDVGMDPIVCIAQYLCLLDLAQRPYPFRLGYEKSNGKRRSASLRVVSLLIFVCTTKLKLFGNSDEKKTKVLKFYTRAFMRNRGVKKSDVQAQVGEKQRRLEAAVADLRTRSAPFVLARRLTQAGKERPTSPHRYMWFPSPSPSLSTGLTWFRSLALRSLSLKEFENINFPTQEQEFLKIETMQYPSDESSESSVDSMSVDSGVEEEAALLKCLKKADSSNGEESEEEDEFEFIPRKLPQSKPRKVIKTKSIEEEAAESYDFDSSDGSRPEEFEEFPLMEQISSCSENEGSLEGNMKSIRFQQHSNTRYDEGLSTENDRQVESKPAKESAENTNVKVHKKDKKKKHKDGKKERKKKEKRKLATVNEDFEVEVDEREKKNQRETKKKSGGPQLKLEFSRPVKKKSKDLKQ